MENFLVYKAFDEPLILVKDFKVTSDLSDWSKLRFAVSKFNETSKGVGVKLNEKVTELESFKEAAVYLSEQELSSESFIFEDEAQENKEIFNNQFDDFLNQDLIEKIVLGVNFTAPLFSLNSLSLNTSSLNIYKKILLHWDQNINSQRSYVMLISPELSLVSVTPELLFKKDNLSLTSMSLAGTVKWADKEMLNYDPKLIREQELVTQSLVKDLDELCVSVDIKEKSFSRYSDIVHAHTPIEAQLKIGVGASQIIDSLHPSPALGVFPKTAWNLNYLKKQRSKAQLPEYFGAPIFMNYDSAEYCAVNIRSVYLYSKNITAPIGCGVLKSSDCHQEYQELLNKKDSLFKELGFVE